MMRSMITVAAAIGLRTIEAAPADHKSTLVINPGTQTGYFKVGDDTGPMNPHGYRPNEFFAAAMIFEGLVDWDPEAREGADGIPSTADDFVVGSLATSWTTSEIEHLARPDTVPYSITFKLREGVTFHDGAKWDAATASLNFDHIMGGKEKAMAGFHDWYGMPGHIDSWEALAEFEFKIIFKSYYEAALRELTFIRPFRMTSPGALPPIEKNEISCGAWKNDVPRVFGTDPAYVCRGVKKPVGTGPYQVGEKLMSTGTSRAPATFNATCYHPHKPVGGAYAKCIYPEGETVAEVVFEKFEKSRLVNSSTYDRVVVRAYASHAAIQSALLDGTLDMAYGVNTLPPSVFISLATDEGSGLVTAHEDKALLNTRTLVLNSAGELNTVSKRKMIMKLIDRKSLWEGELAEEQPMERLFPSSKPYCDVELSSIAALAATTKSKPSDITKPLRFIYMKNVAHQKIIASEVIADLYAVGIQTIPIPLDKAAYNDAMNTWVGDNGDAYVDDGTGYQSFDMALSETWASPYDATSKLFDMTYRWGSGEADAVATSNLEGMTKPELNSLMLSLSTEPNPKKRQELYTEVLTLLHEEAVFLPLTAKKNIAVLADRVSGFEFGSGEFDIPLAQLYPTPPPKQAGLDGGAIAGIVVASVVAFLFLLFAAWLIFREKKGKPVFYEVDPTGGKVPGQR